MIRLQACSRAAGAAEVTKWRLKATWTARMAGRKDYDILDPNDVKVDGDVGRGMRYDPTEKKFVSEGKKYGIKP